MHRKIHSCLIISIFFILCNNPTYSQVPDFEEYTHLFFQSSEVDSFRSTVLSRAGDFDQLREYSLTNAISPSLVFTPALNPDRLPQNQLPRIWNIESDVERPVKDDELAFFPVWKLSRLIQSGKVTSVELTEIFLERLRTFGDTLECVITITDSVAMAQAQRADAELSAGRYLGPLHGIPYGIKDLLSTPEHRTTWGAYPFKDQVIDTKATVVDRLERSGAVLVAKLTLGALAWGDVWYGGKTRNPWNLEQGSSGSSAGSASATVAGLVPFAIGSETLGSIVSPSTRCGASGLRPTFGRVSKHGAMALSWSMDKLGPICRNAIDLALVFDAIQGPDNKDLSVRDFPFNYDYSKREIKTLRIGYLKKYFDRPQHFNHSNDSATLQLLRDQGFILIEKELPDLPAAGMSFILSAEAGAAFDELTRTNQDSLLVRQIKNAWPNTFRASRFIPAVEYINANRLRSVLVDQMNEMMSDIDVLLTPTYAGPQLLFTNLSGHPALVFPNGSYQEGNPGTITLLGNHFDESSILYLARYIQDLTPFEEEIPAHFIE